MSRKPTTAVREPMQVYLDGGDRSLLERVALTTGLPKAEVLRRGLRRFAADVLADESPALAFLSDASSLPATHVAEDVAVNHDDYLAGAAIATWDPPPATRKRKKASE